MKKIFIISLLFLSCKKETIKTNEDKVITHYTVSFKYEGTYQPQCFVNGVNVDSQEGYDVKTGDSVRIETSSNGITNTQTMYTYYNQQSNSILINGVVKSKKTCNCMSLNNKYNVN